MTPTTFLLLKKASGPKCGLRSDGCIAYNVLADAERQQLFLTLTDNNSSGYFSREIVPMARVMQILDAVPADHPWPSKALKDAFNGKSANNAGFLAAALRTEGILSPATDAPHLHVVSGDCAAWVTHMLAAPGEPYQPSEAPGSAVASTASDKPAEHSKRTKLKAKSTQAESPAADSGGGAHADSA